MNVVVIAFAAGAVLCMLSALLGYVAHMHASHPVEWEIDRALQRREDDSDV